MIPLLVHKIGLKNNYNIINILNFIMINIINVIHINFGKFMNRIL